MLFIFSQNINYDPNTGITREYSYGNNLIFEYKTNEDGQYHGRVSSWYENGKKEFINNYKNGKLLGLQQYWNDDEILIKQFNLCDITNLNYDYTIDFWHSSLRENQWMISNIDSIETMDYKYLISIFNFRDNFLCKKIKSYFDDGNNYFEIQLNEKGYLDGVSKEWYSNGQVKFTESYLNNKCHGDFKYYDENGQIIYHLVFNKGDLLDDKIKIWYPNGQIKVNGLNSKWHPNGQKKQEGSNSWYYNGNPEKVYENGILIWYYENGKKFLETNPMNQSGGKKIVNYYNEKGDLIQESTEDGFREFYDNGNISVEMCEICGGGPAGIKKMYYKNGQLCLDYDENNNNYFFYNDKGNLIIERNVDKQGYYKEYYQNSQLKSEGKEFSNERFSYGEYSPSFYATDRVFPVSKFINENLSKVKNYNKDGKWIDYFESGQIKSIKSFNKGRLVEEKKTWHSNGVISSEKNEFSLLNWDTDGNLTSSKFFKDGELEVFHINGKLKLKGSIKNKNKNGLWREWYDSGQLKSRGNYNNGQGFGLIQKWFLNGNLKQEDKYQDYADNSLIYIKEFYQNGNLKYEKRWDIIGLPKYYEEYYNNGQLKVRDKYNYGNYKSSKCFDENGKKIKCKIAPAVYLKNFYDLKK